MTTQSAWITSLVSALSVIGVVRKYSDPPGSLSTADLPASFPEGFQIVEDALTFKAHGGLGTLILDFVIAVEPYGQGTIPQNFTLMITLADALDRALRTATAGSGKLTWEIRAGTRAGPILVADVAYWGVRAIIEGRAHGPQ